MHPMLAVKCHESRTLANVVEGAGLVDSLVANLDLLGLRRWVFKSDQNQRFSLSSMLFANRCLQLNS